MESFELKYFDNLHIIKSHYDKIAEKLDSFCEPMFDDYSLIEKIYNDIPFLMGLKRETLSKSASIELNKKFVFIVLQLFAPKVFIGSNLPRGLRNALAKTMEVKSPSIVSWYCRCAINLFVVYPSFRKDVEHILKGLKHSINLEELESKND